jgi:hypothetical protein
MNKTAKLRVNVFNGARLPFGGSKVLITVLDGFQKQISRRFHNASSVTFTVPFQDNLADNFTVVAFADKHRQAGFMPVRVRSGATEQVDLMLIRNEAAFNFQDARWENLQQRRPELHRLLAAGVSPSQAATRYTDLMERRPEALACFFNIAEAMSQIWLPSGTPLDYLRQLMWGDGTIKADRFFAWAEPELLEEVRRAAEQRVFERVPGSGIFHPGATDSYKQIQFGEGNVQITFHENDRKTIQGVSCMKVECDIDYFRDPGAHALLEVLVNTLTNSMTDPKQVYVLRWMAGRRAGVPEFEPPYVLV